MQCNLDMKPNSNEKSGIFRMEFGTYKIHIELMTAVSILLHFIGFHTYTFAVSTLQGKCNILSMSYAQIATVNGFAPSKDPLLPNTMYCTFQGSQKVAKQINMITNVMHIYTENNV